MHGFGFSGRADRRLQGLLAAAGGGDHDAFRHIYSALFPFVVHRAWCVLRDRAQAEEIAQDTIFAVWASALRYRPDRGSVIGWAGSIAHHRAVERIRQRTADLRREQTVASRDHRIDYDCVYDHVERGLEHEEVARHMKALSLKQRQALILVFHQSRTHRQAAEYLGIPLGTLKSRVRSALVQLRADLTPS